MPNDKVNQHMQICKELSDLYERKNHDYGDAFHRTFLEEGFAMPRIRLTDKLERFKSLTKRPNDQKINDESVRDTLIDLANYAIMTVMELDASTSGGEGGVGNIIPEYVIYSEGMYTGAGGVGGI